MKERRQLPGTGMAGGSRTAALLFVVLILAVAAAVWWYQGPAGLGFAPADRDGADETAEDVPTTDVHSPTAEAEGPVEATGETGLDGVPGETTDLDLVTDGEVGETGTEGGLRSAGDRERPEDHVFTPMDAADRPAVTGKPFDPGLAPDGLVLEAGGFEIPYSVFAIYARPGEPVELALRSRHGEAAFPDARLYAEAGLLESTGDAAWIWEAPREPGVYRIDAVRQRSGHTIRLNAFVLTPASEVGDDGHLNGYRIGAYPDEPLKGLAQYLPPPGFIKVTPENRNLLVSPHFTLGQFLCKQAGDWPKYVTLREEMLGKLEVILAEVNKKGVRADTFHVMSGYRTPFYNDAIGNVEYSRHQWGDASDIFVDVAPEDGVMDDIDRDGKITVNDARYLARLVENLTRGEFWKPYVGGLGTYGITPTHGPFIHVDTRGFKARWSG